MPASGDTPTHTPTPTAQPLAPAAIGEDYVAAFRIENAFKCGGSAHDCMLHEPDALVVARIAMGEAPHSLNDRLYIIWNIKMRAALGYKEAGAHSGFYDNYVDRWGPETDIKAEALCNGGCQYSPARVADRIYFPCRLNAGDPMRAMLCPLDDQLPDFLITYLEAQAILNRDICDMPSELQGYDGFRSPTVSWNGRIDWAGGLPSRQMFRYGNIWRDEYEPDNIFFEETCLAAPTATAVPPTYTATPMATPTMLPTPSVYATVVVEAEIEAGPKEAIPMEFGNLLEVLLWIVGGGGAMAIAGYVWSLLLENIPQWHELPRWLKTIIPIVIAGVLGMLANVVIALDATAFIPPPYDAILLMLVNWLFSQLPIRRDELASGERYGAGP
jgi:hypothetical protein